MVDAGLFSLFRPIREYIFPLAAGSPTWEAARLASPARGPPGHTARGNKRCGWLSHMDHSDGGTLVVDSGRPLLMEPPVTAMMNALEHGRGARPQI